MARTAVNITCDAACALVVSETEKKHMVMKEEMNKSM